ncbi:receptor protein-tyrosine kinase [Caerostris extrusa]|uniref:Receptor protein-tyrosine kinase n=1 Tax=Caerostris extrusa TaxID=172846 RepID=A0AAV4SZJ8_CAEEX|nr:receptor protein-tyrosine kinase [Caerostris extrusa]
MGQKLWLKFTCIWLWCCMIQCHPDTSRMTFHQSLNPSLGSIAAVSSSYEDEVPKAQSFVIFPINFRIVLLSTSPEQDRTQNTNKRPVMRPHLDYF